MAARTSHVSHHVLLVHPDGVVRRTLSTDLGKRGWQVIEAIDVKSAVDTAIKAQPQVILTALRLPGAVGLNFIRTFRSSVEHDVVLVGIANPPAHLRDAKTAGLDLLVETPVNVARLHRSILAIIPSQGPDERRATTKMKRLSK